MDAPVSDAVLQALLRVEKVLVSDSGEREKGKHVERDFELQAPDGTRFKLFTRQNRKLADDFTVGLRWVGPGGESVILARYNGASHPHINYLEKTRFVGKYHIHTATERYMAAGYDDEGFAEPTERYTRMRQALEHLIADCNIRGVRLPPEQLELV